MEAVVPARQFLRWWFVVRTDDPIRSALNRGLGVFITACIPVAVVVLLLFIGLHVAPYKIVMAGALLPLLVVAWWMNRQGTVGGAILMIVISIATIISAIDPVTYTAPFGQPIIVPVLFALPITVAALFVHPWSGAWVAALQMLVLGAFLVLNALPFDHIANFMIFGAINMFVITIVLVIGSRIFNRKLYEAAAANKTLQQLNQKLCESEERYRLISENTADLIALVDMMGRYVYASRSHNVLGYSPDEVCGRILFDFVHPEDLQAIHEAWGGIPNQNSLHATCRFRHADSSWRWIEVSGAVLMRDTLPYVVAVGRDITQRLQLEEQLRRAQQMEVIGRLAGGVAHDFNNALMLVQGYAEMAQARVSADSIVYKDLDEIQKTTHHAAAITQQLLAFARRQVISPQILNLNVVIEDIETMLRQTISESNELLLRCAPDLGLVRADPSQIIQVLLNMAANARDAMPDGGILTITTVNSALDICTAGRVGAPAGMYVLIVVNDTGTGMRAEIKEHLFTPFFTTKAQDKGTGLGLSTCYGIVQQHHGGIEVETWEGQGTTFTIYLPRIEDVAVAPAQLDLGVSLPCGDETILVVEDEAALRTLIARKLREQGYTVLEAGNGEEALHVAAIHMEIDIDLLLTDIAMPIMPGVPLAEQLVMLRPGMKVLFMSGYADTTLSQSDTLGRHMAFMQKPVLLNVLVQKVREMLDVE